MTFRDTDLVILAARNEDDVSHLEVCPTYQSGHSCGCHSICILQLT